MAKRVTQYTLLISCPSDVQEELGIIREIVDDFNRVLGEANNATIVAKHWSKDSYPESGGRPQEILNRQLLPDCDAAVAVFWTRFGTPTGEYGSGTEEEIEGLIKSGKQVFLYFSDCPAKPSSCDPDQYRKVQAFRDRYKNEGVYGTYSSPDAFRKDFLNHLSLYFVRLWTTGNATAEPVGSSLSVRCVVGGKISNEGDAEVFTTDYSGSAFVHGRRESVSRALHDLIKSPLAREVKMPSAQDGGSLSELPLVGLARSLQVHDTVRVFIGNDCRDAIEAYARDNCIDLDSDAFFHLVRLSEGRVRSWGIGPSLGPSLVGTDDEKNRYKSIMDLYRKIIEYQEYVDYFSALDSKYFLNLALTNCGTDYDEDVDVKVCVEHGFLCTSKDLPVPGDSIIEMVSKIAERVYRPTRTVSVLEYDGYPYVPIPVDLPLPPLPWGGPSREEELGRTKRAYNGAIEDTFCYDYFETDGYDIMCFNQKYIKHKTNVFFPSVLVFNSIPNSIQFEISAKRSPQVTKGELRVANVGKGPRPPEKSSLP